MLFSRTANTILKIERWTLTSAYSSTLYHWSLRILSSTWSSRGLSLQSGSGTRLWFSTWSSRVLSLWSITWTGSGMTLSSSTWTDSGMRLWFTKGLSLQSNTRTSSCISLWSSTWSSSGLMPLSNRACQRNCSSRGRPGAVKFRSMCMGRFPTGSRGGSRCLSSSYGCNNETENQIIWNKFE